MSPQIVVLSPGQSTAVASGPQFGVPVVLVGPDGRRAVFNNDEDPDYVGWLTNISGLDSPEVRESADDLIGDDGGIHGDFYYGRRPVVLEGQIDNQPAPHHWRDVGGVVTPLSANEVRNLRMTALMRATNAMRRDLTMRWRPDGGVEQYMVLRRQQPLRISGAFNKVFQVGLVAADPRVYGAAVKEKNIAPATTTDTVENVGSADTMPVLTLSGPATNPVITNFTTGESISLAYTLTAGNSITIDTTNKTVMLNGTTNIYSAVNFSTTKWWKIIPGVNNVRWTSTATHTSASLLKIVYRDAWI